MASFIINEIEDEMVRDFTSVVPMSKSEVRRRINAYAVKAFIAGQKEERQFILNILDGIDIADEQSGNTTGGTKAIRFALQARIID